MRIDDQERDSYRASFIAFLVWWIDTIRSAELTGKYCAEIRLRSVIQSSSIRYLES
jgi:hypothetical protein